MLTNHWLRSQSFSNLADDSTRDPLSHNPCNPCKILPELYGISWYGMVLLRFACQCNRPRMLYRNVSIALPCNPAGHFCTFADGQDGFRHMPFLPYGIRASPYLYGFEPYAWHHLLHAVTWQWIHGRASKHSRPLSPTTCRPCPLRVLTHPQRHPSRPSSTGM